MPSPAPSVKSVLSPIAADMQQLDQVIRTSLHSEVSLINQISDYIINAGGKRLRPALVILTARALGANPQQMQQAIELAAIVEFIHTATLLHDDVVDESDMRRGRLTANAEYGNSAAVLVGDFLYSRSFQMMVKIGLMDVMDVLSEATNTIAEGEVLQLLNCKDPDVTEARYMQVIDFKTAKLFEASCRLAGIVTGQSKEAVANLGRFGAEVGSAFQLIDDVLDYAGESAALGKNVGDDLREGKPTLPLIHAMQHAAPQVQTQIRDAIANGGTQDVSAIMASIEQTGSLAYTRNKAQALSESAKTRLGKLTGNPYTEALAMLCDVAVNRNS
ncbi:MULTISPECIES: polyprenyl synthetase family protein [Limnobacter]|jgi:octaprenyl-diphosphate synthase|uniref:Octaprenyl diphosphate synthase n=3 Tax=Limnobacter TaxID=131079 RepID=A0ABX6N7W9_9BURK|nr:MULTISPECIES: polyprenyl synthetase family protein [unclassified Limnobacter]MBA4314760.1 octaprenyl diphosphate synthase [Alcaligenaceae bacterium]MDP3271008.1 polyprenyl synthetase family protein [Limnobacter sp.]MDZ4050005.1 polyprenyl synthetase family protein [Limnobacter sp.]QJR30524.1 octaprenyl diphosphate synthase [Limnobacter sp. SAORIC-580]RZO90496.1 MAG: octaprenyl diphosphate synthase [Limnobacter sp.]